MVTETTTRSHCINKIMSIFSAEVYAVILALNYILQNQVKSSVIYTDSLSCVHAITSLHTSKNFLVQRAQYIASKIINKGYSLTLCWVPSHVGIPGNERADRAAAAALVLDITPFDVPLQDLRPAIKKSINVSWQNFWREQKQNKLHLVKPNIGSRLRDLPNRLQDVLLCRLRIGHTYLTHGFLLRREEPPQCTHCGALLSVIHILISCPSLESHRQRHFTVFYRNFLALHPALLLGDDPFIPFQRVYDFLRETGYLGNL